MWRKAVPIAAAVLVLCTTRIMTAGELGHWAFDEGSGTTVRDSSSKGNNGTLVNGPLWVDGKLGKALQFDGVDDYVQVPHNASLIPTTGKATVSVWINAKRHTGPGGSSWQGILAKEEPRACITCTPRSAGSSTSARDPAVRISGRSAPATCL